MSAQSSSSKKKKQKREEPQQSLPPPPLPADWKRCHGYLPAKSRYCRQLPAPGLLFCGTHQPAASALRKRVPCPIDPRHDVYEDMLAKHMKKCPRARLNRQQMALPCYRCDCNSGGGSERIVEQQQQQPTWQWAENVARAVLVVHQHVFHATTTTAAAALSFDDIDTAIALDDASTTELTPLTESIAACRIKSGGPHHRYQQASIVGHLRRRRQEATTTTTTTVLELGAGRGITGLVVAGVAAASTTASTSTRLIMIERDTARHSAGKWLRQGTVGDSNDDGYMRLQDVQATRIRCDLAHVDMAQVLLGSSSSSDSTHNAMSPPIPAGDSKNGHEATTNTTTDDLIIVAKHLCGAGTDLALCSLLRMPPHITTNSHVRLVMSTCCHGVCNWNDYVGRTYLSEAMMDVGCGLSQFGEAEFELLRLWSSGTCKPHDKTESNTTHPSSVNAKTAKDDGDNDEHTTTDACDDGFSFPLGTLVQRLGLRCGVQGVGRACQRVIDYGRREFIRNELGFRDESSLVYHVPSSVTLQNALLVAQKKNNTSHGSE